MPFLFHAYQPLEMLYMNWTFKSEEKEKKTSRLNIFSGGESGSVYKPTE